MTHHLETMAQLADRLDLDYPRLQWHLRHRPLPPVAIIRGSKIGVAYTEEQARWYIAHIPQGAGRHTGRVAQEWATPYDDTHPREYVGIPEIAKATGKTGNRTILTKAHQHGLEPDVKIGTMYGWTLANAQTLIDILNAPRRRGTVADDLLNRGGVAKMLGVTIDTVRDYQLPPADRHIQTGGDPMPVWYRTTIKRWHATRNKRTLRKTAHCAEDL